MFLDQSIVRYTIRFNIIYKEEEKEQQAIYGWLAQQKFMFGHLNMINELLKC